MSGFLIGQIRDSVPYFYASQKKGTLVFQHHGDLAFTVDTGFTGSICIPAQLLRKLDVELVDYGSFRLATGKTVELPIYWGKVKIHNKNFETWFVPGDPLVGMEFLSSFGSQLQLLFKQKLLLLK